MSNLDIIFFNNSMKITPFPTFPHRGRSKNKLPALRDEKDGNEEW
jgi:hypothetical protein